MATKKDFDKDYIFNLIMPSAPEPLPEEPEEPEIALEAQAEESAALPDSLDLLRERLEPQAVAPNPTLQRRAAKERVLVNLMEQLIADRLDDAIEKFNCCRCDRCRQDIAVLTLNALPARYVSAEPEELPGLLAACPTREISPALVKAILEIKNHPRH